MRDALKDNSRTTLSERQSYLGRLIRIMHKTQIGRIMNEAGAKTGLIWCIDEKRGKGGTYYGAPYNIILLNADYLDEKTQAAFNTDVSIGYHENAHAWMHSHEDFANTHNSQAWPRHKIIFYMASEFEADTIMAAALQQHKEQGDIALWNDNAQNSLWSSGIAQDLFKMLDEKRDMSVPVADDIGALRAVFDTHFIKKRENGPFQFYVSFYADTVIAYAGLKMIEDEEFLSVLGKIPGGKSNFLIRPHFTLADPFYSDIPDMEAHAKILAAEKKLLTAPPHGAPAPGGR
ncbi:MAG: hypothetical protein HY370_06150 [Proteobacteria bacterium]|nr:hypothetical protein [Pseudomonadota bacterium]